MLVDDGNVAYTIVTAPAISADPNYNGMDAADVALTNNDNDHAGITVTPVTSRMTTEAGGTATFSVVLNPQPTAQCDHRPVVERHHGRNALAGKHDVHADQLEHAADTSR